MVLPSLTSSSMCARVIICERSRFVRVATRTTNDPIEQTNEMKRTTTAKSITIRFNQMKWSRFRLGDVWMLNASDWDNPLYCCHVARPKRTSSSRYSGHNFVNLVFCSTQSVSRRQSEIESNVEHERYTKIDWFLFAHKLEAGSRFWNCISILIRRHVRNVNSTWISWIHSNFPSFSFVLSVINHYSMLSRWIRMIAFRFLYDFHSFSAICTFHYSHFQFCVESFIHHLYGHHCRVRCVHKNWSGKKTEKCYLIHRS